MKHYPMGRTHPACRVAVAAKTAQSLPVPEERQPACGNTTQEWETTKAAV
ncbi:MAG: hypothetical protein V1792_29620 [Pseudomonadota bacterium]